MSDMEKMDNERIYLYLDADFGTVMIPFLGLKEVDLFTTRYSDKVELINSLSYLLKLPISESNVKSICLFDKHGIYSVDKEKSRLDVKYKGDNFNLNSLKHAFSVYLKQNPQRIKNSDIKYLKDIRTKARCDFDEGRPLTGFDIDVIAKLYLDRDEYKRARYVYFLIKDLVPIKKDKVVRERDSRRYRNLSTFGSGNDDYFQYLASYSSKGEEEYDKAMEEMSLFDFDEIGSSLNQTHYGLFDGAFDDPRVSLDDLDCLEEYTGISIENLMNLVANEREMGYRNGRRR